MIRETKKHLISEESFAYDLEGIFNCDFRKTAKFSKIDYAMIRDGKIFSFGELKCRNFSYLKYDSVLCNIEKWLYMITIVDSIKMPVFLFVRYSDNDIYLEVSGNIKTECVYKTDSTLCAKILIERNLFKNVEKSIE